MSNPSVTVINPAALAGGATIAPTHSTDPKIGDEYVLVKKGCATNVGSVTVDIKTSGGTLAAPSLPKELSALHMQRPAMRRSGGANGVIPITLTQMFTVSNNSAGLNQRVIVLDPFNSTEYASIASLYEQVRVRRVRIQHFCASTAISTLAGGVLSNDCVAGCSVDSITATALTTLADATDSKCYALYKQAVTYQSTNPLLSVIRPSTDAKLTYTPPKSFIPNAATANLVGGNWTATSSSGGIACPCGYLKYFESNAHANSQIVGTVSLIFDCDFRNRD